jgi:hypothetical protein
MGTNILAERMGCSSFGTAAGSGRKSVGGTDVGRKSRKGVGGRVLGGTSEGERLGTSDGERFGRSKGERFGRVERKSVGRDVGRRVLGGRDVGGTDICRKSVRKSGRDVGRRVLGGRNLGGKSLASCAASCSKHTACLVVRGGKSVASCAARASCESHLAIDQDDSRQSKASRLQTTSTWESTVDSTRRQRREAIRATPRRRAVETKGLREGARCEERGARCVVRGTTGARSEGTTGAAAYDTDGAVKDLQAQQDKPIFESYSVSSRAERRGNETARKEDARRKNDAREERAEKKDDGNMVWNPAANF